MVFITINYFFFLLLLFVLYYILPDKFQWILLLISSTFFYLIGNIATIIVPVIIILCTFICGILIERSSNVGKKKAWFLIGLFINFGLLIFFKYINFFISTAYDGLNLINYVFRSEQTINHTSIVLQLVIPLGLSYITFQAVGYLIEINRCNQKSEKHLGLFATYLMFFPKLLSGPIERAQNFIPQLYQKHEFNLEQIVKGLKRILWGLFLKLVVANRLALYTDAVFNNYKQHSGITLLIASIFFTVQLFADFAGYTDMAIGSAQILGYQLMENFNSPFIAKSITEFWRRWHISLTTWVNDYIYNPIVINIRSWGESAIVLASLITFLVLGFWHGASWTFIIFGFLQGFILSIEFLTRKFRKQVRSKVPSWINTFLGTGFTCGFFCFSTIFFKANNTSDAFSIIKRILTFKGPFYIGTPSILIYCLFGLSMLLLKVFTDEYTPSHFLLFESNHKLIRVMSYSSIFILILLIGVFDGGQFIYFKF